GYAGPSRPWSTAPGALTRGVRCTPLIGSTNREAGANRPGLPAFDDPGSWLITWYRNHGRLFIGARSSARSGRRQRTDRSDRRALDDRQPGAVSRTERRLCARWTGRT